MAVHLYPVNHPYDMSITMPDITKKPHRSIFDLKRLSKK